jgi:carnitine O-acetyltransferase
MFDACRVPGPGMDWSVSYAKPEDTGDAGHIVVLRRGRFWKLDIAKDGRLLGVDDLAQYALSSPELCDRWRQRRQLAHVYAHTPDEHPAVGVLGAAPRDAWARDYAALAADAHNALILKDVHAAALVLCLDTETPEGPVPLSRALWHGAHARGAPLGLRNRWVDKPVQLVVTGAPVVCFYPGRRLRVRR